MGDFECPRVDFESEIELAERIGGGGVGIIYKGYYRNNKGRGREEEVAVKTLFDPRMDERLRQEFLDELLVMSRLEAHSNIVNLVTAPHRK